MQADKLTITRLLKTARGQIDGILTMVEQDRYCMDIATQLMAAGAIIKKANKEVLTAHLTGCVKAAQTETALEEKIRELTAVLDKLL